ncbi:MAG: hypothetical protein QGG40_19655, partial [Myxococcota bacterium]|nr:hypothetical protein [Myxococcota bacterium]
MKRALFLALLVTSGLASSRDALALSCSEIMNLVDLNVPTNIIVDTMAQSGDRFSSDDVRCLTDEGAPQSVIEQAKKMTRTSAESEERDREPAPVQRSSRSSADDDVIGSRSSRRKEIEDLGSEDTSSDPRRIQEAIKLLKAKKPLTASLMLYELLEDGTFPEQEGQIHYYLGRSFTMLEMYHAAHLDFPTLESAYTIMIGKRSCCIVIRVSRSTSSPLPSNSRRNS